MDLTTDKLRSLVRKWQTLIEANVDVKTTDGYFLRLFCISFTKKRPGQVKKTAYAQSSQVRATERWGAWHAFYENRLGRDGCVDAAAGSCSCSCTCAAARLRASPRDTIPNPGRQPSHPVLLPTAAHCTPQLPLHPCTASARRSAPSAARWLRS